MGGSNKKHKSRFKSKSESNKKGKVEKIRKGHQSVKLSASGNQPNSKQMRIAAAQQKRKDKRANLIQERRLGTSHGPPKIVGFIGLSDNVDPSAVCSKVVSLSGSPLKPHQIQNSPSTHSQGPTYYFPDHKQRLTVLSANADLDRQLDLAKVSDVVVLVLRVTPKDNISMAGSHMSVNDDEIVCVDDDNMSTISKLPDVNQYGMNIDVVGRKFLSILSALGLPTVAIALVGLDEITSNKYRRTLIRLHTIYFRDYFPDTPKVIVCDSVKGATEMVRHLSSITVRKLQWREEMPYMLVDRLKWEPNPEGGPELLSVSGYLRGRNFSANSLAHISHIGTFQIHSIFNGIEPCPLDNKTNQMTLLQKATAKEPLQWCREVDPLANEQTWPTSDDLIEPSDAMGENDSDGEEGEDDDAESSDSNPLPEYLREDEDNQSSKTKRSAISEIQTQIDSLMKSDLKRFENMTPEQIKAERERLELDRKAAIGAAGDERMYPDQVDTPLHIPARQRFMRYRGLNNIKYCKWDPYESLPLDYGRLYQFHNIKQTKKRVWEDFVNMPIKSDSYITILLENVPKVPFSAAQEEIIKMGGIMSLCGLRRHEHKWSVMHYSLQFSQHYTQPLKSKDSVLLHVGFRVLRCNPIYSEHNLRASSHKFMRYFQPEDKFAVASAYGPITFSPCPVLCFVSPQSIGETANLVAYGSVLGADPNRIILKKVLLSGAPVRIHKRQAVVRFMFFNEKDVNWFKPVQLHTRFGQVGHIKEPVGTHGYMKCQFTNTLRSEDAVYMALYKRVYPKWTTIPSSWIPAIEQQYRVPSLEMKHNPEMDEEEHSMQPNE